MSIDLNPIAEKIIPAVPEKIFPLLWMRLLHIAGTPQSMRVYCELQPYRRIFAEVPVTVPTITPVLDPDGNPVLDEQNNPVTQTVDTPTGETRSVLVGSELKPEVDGDITALEIPNILPASETDEAGSALIQQTIGAFVAQGGNLAALTMASILLIVKQAGAQQGKLT